ncbi:MAG: erythromycin esterase family protein [Longimicrobiaceae bacterium]
MSTRRHFRIAALAAGLALCLAPGAPAQEVPPAAAARALEPGPPLERTLAAGETHDYTVALAAGDFLRVVVEQRGVDLVVEVFGPDGARLMSVDSPNGDQGPEEVAFQAPAAGAYRVHVRAFSETDAGAYTVRVAERLGAAEYASVLARERVRRDSVLAWLAASAMPLRSVTAGSGFEDLRPLREVLRDVRIVGLGEATHGSREFFQLKHRLLEFLVREMGFRVFAIEASRAAAENVINPWVLGGEGEVGPVLDSQGFWTWNTEEVRALLEWMRAYNRGVPPERRVRFRGIDIQVNRTGEAAVLAYLRRVAPARVAPAETLFAIRVDLLAQTSGASGPLAASAGARLKETVRGYEELLGYLALNETRFAELTSPAELAAVLGHARTLAQYAAAYSIPGTATGESSGSAQRDRFMADNLRRLLDAEPPGTRVVLWAHNGHVQAEPSDGMPTLGTHLRRWYGNGYYALGFAFASGAFQARDATPNATPPLVLREFRLEAPQEGSVNGYFARARPGDYLVDFRRAPRPTAARAWLAAPGRMISIGSAFATTWPESAIYQTVAPGRAFDGIAFIRETTRARPNPTVSNVMR